MSRSMLQKTIERNNRAFGAFFRRVKRGETPGFPRFKSRRRYNTIATQYGRGVKLLDSGDERVRGNGAKTSYLYWRGVGAIRFKLHRTLPKGARITEVQLTRQADGWHVCFCLELAKPTPLCKTGRSVGIDLGITNFVAISDGASDELIPGPRAQRKAEQRVASLSSQLARKLDKRSNRRRRAALQLRKVRLKEARIRRDHQHKLARRLVRGADVIYIEDLNVKGLADSYLAKDVRDQGWSQFRRIIADKAAEAGRLLILVDSKASSQECSGCGRIVKKPLSERMHACTCGLVIDRDVNAARITLRRGERQREAVSAVRPRPRLSRSAKSGDRFVPRSTKRRENR
jgi:putative transposase